VQDARKPQRWRALVAEDVGEGAAAAALVARERERVVGIVAAEEEPQDELGLLRQADLAQEPQLGPRPDPGDGDVVDQHHVGARALHRVGQPLSVDRQDQAREAPRVAPIVGRGDPDDGEVRRRWTVVGPDRVGQDQGVDRRLRQDSGAEELDAVELEPLAVPTRKTHRVGADGELAQKPGDGERAGER
jgi:hypothetical protein